MKINRQIGDLWKLLIDPGIAPVVEFGSNNAEDHPDFLGSFELNGRIWHAFAAHPGARVRGWSVCAGDYHTGSDESLDDFLRDPQAFANDRDSWIERDRPGWEHSETVRGEPDRNGRLLMRFVPALRWDSLGSASLDPAWDGEGW